MTIAFCCDHAARFTTAEFIRMNQTGAFDDMKLELIHGELYRADLARSEHARLQALVMIALGNATAGGNFVTIGSVGIDLGQDTLVGCDAAVINSDILDDRYLMPGGLHLVVEIAEIGSTTNED